MPNKYFSKQIRPVPNRTCSLWKGCIFALNAGWDKGPVGTLATRESVRRQKGVIGGSISGVYQKSDFGRGLSAGGSLDNVAYADTSNRYDSNQYLSVAALVRPRVNSVAADGGLVCKRQNTLTSSEGWTLQCRNTLSDPWAFEISDGVTENRAQSTVDAVTDRTDMLVGTFSDPDDLIRLFVNGAMNVSAAAANSLVNNNVDLTVFGFGDNDAATVLDSIVGMAGVWNRVLSSAEIALLYADPYVMWRPMHREFMFGPGNSGVAVASTSTFFLSF